MTASSATPASPSYAIVQGDAVRDRETVLALWDSNLDAGRDRSGKFDWFYLNGPWGRATFHLLRYEPSGAWVGTAAIGPRCMRMDGRAIRAGVLADMAVATQHRSLGPALMLQGALAETAAGEFDLVYGFPNRAASAVMRRIGYPVLGQMPRFVCVLRHHAYLERWLPRLLARPLGWLLDQARHMRGGAWRFSGAPHAEWQDRADARMDELWRRSVPRDTLMAPRDLAWLRWRFDQFPGCGARYLVLSDPRDHAIQAWFACRFDEAHLRVCDFWSVDAGLTMGQQWIAALIRAARAAKCATIGIEYAAPQFKLRSWLAQGFVERDHRFVVARWLGDSASRPLPKNYHFTSADEDV